MPSGAPSRQPWVRSRAHDEPGDRRRKIVADVLAGLKGFQRKTVDHVFRRMYDDPDPATRFLVADEVGLGKTLVARGLIAKTIQRLQEQHVKRIDVIYICSNAEIARQNIQRLNVTGQSDFSLASRITLLPCSSTGSTKTDSTLSRSRRVRASACRPAAARHRNERSCFIS